ncbi:MAG: hypothetical protein HMLIMOIP_002059 [Candidatus Nitrosomirales archaeon]|jgi:hypothetical protein
MAGVAALVCFILACLKIEPFQTVKMIPLGLFFLTLFFLVGPWPIGFIVNRKQ